MAGPPVDEPPEVRGPSETDGEEPPGPLGPSDTEGEGLSVLVRRGPSSTVGPAPEVDVEASARGGRVVMIPPATLVGLPDWASGGADPVDGGAA